MLAETKATDPAESCVTFTEKTRIHYYMLSNKNNTNPLKMVDWVDGEVDSK